MGFLRAEGVCEWQRGLVVNESFVVGGSGWGMSIHGLTLSGGGLT